MNDTQITIAKLARRHIETFSWPENLDLPVDGDVNVTIEGDASVYHLMVDGKVASRCRVIHYQQQFGSAVLRMGGIAGVSTPKEFRFKGYSRRVMESTLRWMRANGFDVAMLYGIGGFYPKYGYAEAFPRVTHTTALRDAELVKAHRLRWVDFQAGHTRAVLKMYDRVNTDRIGPVIRNIKTWAPFRKGVDWGLKALGRVGLDSAGKPAAYLAYDVQSPASIVEAGWKSPAAFADILTESARLAWEGRCETVTFHLAEDDPFIAFCKPLGMTKTVQYRRDGGAMIRMINIASALTKAAPILAGRMGQSKGNLNIHTNLDSVALNWADGKLAVAAIRKGAAGDSASMPQWALAQLLYGYGDIATMGREGIIRAGRAALETLARIFPQTPHFHYKVDEF